MARSDGDHGFEKRAFRVGNTNVIQAKKRERSVEPRAFVAVDQRLRLGDVKRAYAAAIAKMSWCR